MKSNAMQVPVDYPVLGHPDCSPNGPIPYFWQFHGKEGPGKTVTILGRVYGNETVGGEAVHRLIDLAQQGVKKGTLKLGIGNPAAARLNKRFVEKDLNRCFGKNEGNTLEEARAEEMKPELVVTNVLIDVHSLLKEVVSKKKDSEVMILQGNKEEHPLAKPVISQLGIKTLISGAGLWHPSGLPTDTDHFVAAHGGLGLTVEAGWQHDEKIEEIMAGLIRALKFLEIFDEDLPGTETHPVPESQIEHYEAYWYVIAEPNFIFTQEWKNFQMIPKGTFFAFSNGKPLIAPKDSYMLFAKSKKNMVVGQQVCILLEKAA